jgi:predicted HTH domain antitoxin
MGKEIDMRTLKIEFPESLLDEADERRLAALAREAFYVKLYEQGLIGSGKGASLLGISRREFLDLVGTYNVSIFDENINFEEELRAARPDERA